MQRITITIDDGLVDEMDKLITVRGYQNRSEAVRDLVRAGLVATKSIASHSQECVASMAYVYDRHTRELPKRLAHAFQDHHDLCVATMRVTLDHDSCMEVSALRGPTAEVERFAESIIAERGVRHGRLTVIPAEIKSGRHAHGAGQAHSHEHIRVW
jgi:CopG family transcriptional regulator, nickel-responsive regulator